MRHSWEFLSAAAFSVEELAQLFARGFEGYFVPVRADAVALAQRLRADQVDLAQSLVASEDGKPLALALAARRGWTRRVAAMGVATEARGQGLGRALMERLEADARAAGERRLLLEVLEPNEAAAGLYRSCGFRVRRALVGFAREAFEPAEDATLRELDPAAFARRWAMEGPEDPPWQLAAESLATAAAPARAFALGDSAFALFAETGDAGLQLRALMTAREARGQGRARQLVEAVQARFPARRWAVAPFCPEEWSGALTALGFLPTPLRQFEMEKDL